MAKYECTLRANLQTVMAAIEEGILKGSVSASLEDRSDFTLGEGDAQCAVRVFERYSITGSNRVSLSVTVFGRGTDLYLSAITAGGSQAVFLKFNTFGEETFLDALKEVLAGIPTD